MYCILRDMHGISKLFCKAERYRYRLPICDSKDKILLRYEKISIESDMKILPLIVVSDWLLSVSNAKVLRWVMGKKQAVL